MSIDPLPTVRNRSRLAALRRTGLLDSPPEPAFDRLTRLACTILQTSMAMVTLIDEGRQFFKSSVGLPAPLAAARETPLALSFCQYTAALRAPLIVGDTRADPLVAHNPAIHEHNALAYAGVPVLTVEGEVLGTLCVIDNRVRDWTPHEVAVLEDLAQSVMTEIALRGAIQETRTLLEASEYEHGEKAALLESTGEGIYGIDDEGRCTFLNRAAAAMLGYSPDEVLGRNMHHLIHHSHPDGSPYAEDDCPIFQSLREGHGARLDDELLWRRDGTSFVAEYACDPIRTVGHLTGAVVTFMDVTERKRTETALRLLASAGALLAQPLAAEAELQGVADLVVEHSADWCTIDLLDQSGTVRRVATAHTDPMLAAWARTAHLAHTSDSPDDPLRTGQARLMDLLPAGTLWATTGEGATVDVAVELRVRSALIVPLRTTRHHILGILTMAAGATRGRYTQEDLPVAQDLARRIAAAVDNARLYRDAQEAVRVRNDFLTTVSHDLRSPLTVIQGRAQLLTEQVAHTTDPRLQPMMKGLTQISGGATRLARLIDQLVDLAHLEAGEKLQLNLVATDLVALVSRVVAEAGASTVRHTLHLETGSSTLMAEVDAARIERVVANLVSNAIKYSPQGGAIVVRVAEHAPGEAILEVRDEGVGIPAADLHRVLERFQRASNVGAIEGSGIGLASAQQILQEHGGALRVTSEEGHGTVVTATLPLAPPQTPR